MSQATLLNSVRRRLLGRLLAIFTLVFGLVQGAQAAHPIAGHDSSHRLFRVSTFYRGECARVEPEEYPVMNLETLGFKLKPDNFFDWNPALDLPKR